MFFYIQVEYTVKTNSCILYFTSVMFWCFVNNWQQFWTHITVALIFKYPFQIPSISNCIQEEMNFISYCCSHCSVTNSKYILSLMERIYLITFCQKRVLSPNMALDESFKHHLECRFVNLLKALVFIKRNGQVS